MKFVLKERKINEQQSEETKKPALAFNVKMSPEAFLRVTPPGADIEKRAKMAVGDFSLEKAGEMYIVVDPNSGRVTEHGGRARATAAKNAGYSKLPFVVKLPLESQEIPWEQMPYDIKQEGGGNGVISKVDDIEFISTVKQTNYSEEKDLYKTLLNGPNGPVVGDIVSTGQQIKRAASLGILRNKKIIKPKPGKDAYSKNIDDFIVISLEDVK